MYDILDVMCSFINVMFYGSLIVLGLVVVGGILNAFFSK